MNVWQESWAYRIWVVGGLIGIVAFSVIGSMSDPGNQDFILYLIPVIGVWMAGIFVLQWRGVQRDPQAKGPVGGLVRSNILLGALLCAAIFTGVFLFYSDIGGTLYPLGESGPGLPVALLPAFALIVFGVIRTLNTLRELSAGPSEADGPTDFEGPTDIQAPAEPHRRSGGPASR